MKEQHNSLESKKIKVMLLISREETLSKDAKIYSQEIQNLKRQGWKVATIDKKFFCNFFKDQQKWCDKIKNTFQE